MIDQALQILGGIGAAICFLTAFGCWFLIVIGYFKAIANRKPGVSRWRAYNWLWEVMLNRNVYLDRFFTETGAWWLKVSFLAVPGFILACLLAALLGFASGIAH